MVEEIISEHRLKRYHMLTFIVYQDINCNLVLASFGEYAHFPFKSCRHWCFPPLILPWLFALAPQAWIGFSLPSRDRLAIWVNL